MKACAKALHRIKKISWITTGTMENNACIVLLHHRNNANLFRRSKCADFAQFSSSNSLHEWKNPYKRLNCIWKTKVYCFSKLKKSV